jgi:DNA-binding IscR family transcriptional regulator
VALSSRFAVAVHILTLLELGEGVPLTSAYLAASVRTDPGVIRRLLTLLARAGLTRSRLGAGGGTLPARGAAEVSLRDVYRAVEAGDVFAQHRETPSPICLVGRHIQSSLQAHMDAATRALEAELATKTIADILADIRRRDRTPHRPLARVRAGSPQASTLPRRAAT